MASPRATTPLEASSPPEMQLSPRSRIEARLAAIDTSSDEDEPRQASRRHETTLKHAGSAQDEATASENSDDDDVVRPRGRLAARMQVSAPATEQSTSKPVETFQDRIERRMQSEEMPEDSTGDAVMHDAEAADEDEDIPIAPRRLTQRKPREATPDASSPVARSSPGLFVSPDRHSPAKAGEHDGSDTENELPNLKNNARFQALVERKRQERLAREAEEVRKREERMSRQDMAAELFGDSDEDNVSDIADDEGGIKLTQEARPTRKASKKAIEEINRETQRMARSMQLAHEARTRKKITKASLFERFNFRPAGVVQTKNSSSSRPTTPTSAHHTDVEMKDVETPPSSPPLDKTTPPQAKAVAETTETGIGPHPDLDELPTLDEALDAVSKKLEKGKGKAIAIESPEKIDMKAVKIKRQVRIKLPPMSTNFVTVDSDDELEITAVRKTKLDAIFDSMPSKKANESKSLFAQRRLAQVGSPGKELRRKDKKSAMSASELQFSLQQRARQQAKTERERRVEILKSKGIVIQTEEERERQMQEVEDIVAKARLEAEEIMDRERDDAKKERKERKKNGELDPLGWDDSEDDDDYEGSEEEVERLADVELSGSDEDEQEDGEEVEEEGDEIAGDNVDGSDAETVGNPLLDDEAGEDDSEASAEVDDTEELGIADSEEEMDLPAKNVRRQKKNLQIVSDDEDDVEATPKPKTTVFKSPTAPNTDSPKVPTSVLRSATKTFIPGLPVKGAAGLGLTQIFAGTMDDSQTVPGSAFNQTPMPTFDNFPDSNFSNIDNEPADDMILDSQGVDTQRAAASATQGIQIHFSQSQMHGFDSLLREEDATQVSIEATQDAGLRDYTPLRQRFVEPPASTVETLVLDRDAEADMPNDSPLVRRGRLRRKADTTTVPEEDTESKASADEDEFGFNTSAFTAMQEAAKKQKKKRAIEEFNRKKSKAKEMVQEQADESEDEYAGLGGVDGEDSSDDDAGSVKEMINDEAGNDADKHQLAAFYADRERASDEKAVDKLFHDITTGMLRRKRGAEYDLSDSDDDGEARRRMKRRQFAKMQQALFTDERVKKIAENPGNQAFLRTIEDRGSGDEMDFLDIGPETMETEESQSQGQTIPDSQPAAGRQPLGTVLPGNRAPANMRRTKDGKKPSNIGEIRESLSSLLEEPNTSVIPATDLGSDSDADDESRPSTSRSNKENHSPGKSPGRNSRRNARPAVIDRISLKRASSSNLSTSSRLAFAMPASAASSFKVPALLRRATTNSLMSTSSTSSTGVTTQSGAFGDEGKIKKSAGKRSGVSYLARETERQAAMQEKEKRREAKKWKGAERRVKAVGGLFGGGKFE